MEFEITNYESADEAEILILFDQFKDYLIEMDPLNWQHRLPGYAKNLLAGYLSELNSVGGAFFVARQAHKIVGFVIGVILNQSTDEALANKNTLMGRIEELYVVPNRRGQGIGKVLMKKIEDYFQSQGCTLFWVEVFAPNERTHKFYKNLGYSDRNIDMVKSL